MKADSQVTPGGFAAAGGEIANRRGRGADGFGNLGVRHAELFDSFRPSLHGPDLTEIRNSLSTALRNGTPLQCTTMTIGERIRQAREHGPAAKVSRKDLAAAAGIAYSTLADVENGLSSNTTALHRIARRLKVRVEWLETGKGPMESAQDAQSQSVRLDPEIVRDVAQALQEVFREELGREYSITDDPELFVEMYERTVARGEVDSRSNMVWLGARIGPTRREAISDEQGTSVHGQGDAPRKARSGQAKG